MVSLSTLFSQMVLGLVNGSLYALLSLGMAIIFGLLNVINFAHGAQYMMGAFAAYLLLNYAGLGYWPALVLAPLIVGVSGIVIERLLLRHLYQLDHLYGMVLTFGLTLILEGVFRFQFGSAGLPYAIPDALTGAVNLGFMYMPTYRAWVVAATIVICAATWFTIEKTHLGAYLRAATENPMLVQNFGINVPRMVMLTYGCGVALAALAGVMAAPVYQVSPHMGSNIIVVVFAVVVIGGMGSILGAIISGFALGVIEGMAKYFYPQGSVMAIFVIMIIVLLLKPAGLFGRIAAAHPSNFASQSSSIGALLTNRYLGAALLLLALVAPSFIYPLFLMKVFCLALFACAFALLAGHVGMLSFGHAAFFGSSAYICAYAAKTLGWPPELSILAGTAIAALIGLVFGWLSIRRQGIYFAMVTLALAQMIYFIALQADFTGGEDGIQAVPRGVLFGLFDLNDTYIMYYLVFAIFLIGFFIVQRTIRSPFGQILKGISQNEARMISLGYKTKHYKLLTFVLSAALAGLAGSTKALVIGLASLTDVHWAMSGEVLLMALIGGIGTMLGPVIGALIVVTVATYLAWLGAWVTVIQGITFVVCVMVFRIGVVGGLESLVARLVPRRSQAGTLGAPAPGSAIRLEGEQP